jgi:tripeptide aminopeptidase
MMNNLINKLMTLVAIDSESGHEEKIAAFTLSWLKHLDYSYYQDRLGNILASPKNSQPTFLMCAHLDTVSPGKNIKPLVKHGYIQSQGKTILGADNKAAIAAMMQSVEDYYKIFHQLPNIELLFTVKEETGGGLEYFPFKKIRSKKGLIFDYAAPIGSIITSSPHIINFHIKILGTSAHASRPEAGRNALASAVDMIDKIGIGKIDQHQTLINIGQFSAGTSINTVPDQANFSGEIRCFDTKIYQSCLNRLSTFANQHCHITFDGYCPGYSFSSHHALVKYAADVISTLGVTPKLELSASVSDANILNSVGIDTITLSDGVENPHTTKERIRIKSLIQLCELVSLFLTH